MNKINLFDLRSLFNQSNIMLCFNGPISRSIIEEIGIALKNHLQVEQAQMKASLDVFGVYIEMSQNIRHYAKANNFNDIEASATVIIARDDDNHYLVQAGNMVKVEDGDRLLNRVQQLADMTPEDLKKAYKKQLRAPHSEDAVTGAGLGLIDIARKSNKPLHAKLAPIDNQHVFFSICATI